jgi:PAS domain S-box-containing protein
MFMKKWFNGLKVSQKLALISIFFIMPDSLMLYLFITGINENIQFARMEQKGNAYQRPLEELLELIPQHRSLAQRTLSGELSGRELAVKKQAQIDAAFDALQSVDAHIGTELQFTAEGLAKRKREHCRVGTVRGEWENLKNGLAQLDLETCAARHLHLMSDVRTMITHAGDLSNLILDPDLDSYYLMDVTLLALPQTQDRLATVMDGGEAAIKRRTISNEERQQLAIHATFLKEDLDRISGSVQTALNEDANFHGSSATLHAKVPAAIQEYMNSATAFIGLTSRLVDSGTGDVTAEEYFAVGSKARESSFRLWKIADEELDKLLQKRIDAYKTSRARSLIVAAFAFLAAVSFVSFITRSISGPLRQQATELTSANKSLQAEITERNRVEQELRRSETQLAAAQKIARIGSWEWDLLSRKMTWSDENYRIHGAEPHEFEADYDASLKFIHPDDRSLSDTTIKRTIENGTSFSFEQRIIRADGTERVIHQRGDAVLDPEGWVVKLFGTAQDVTEHKRAEEELEIIHKQLLDTSRQAGMAEVATGVLHNVGNVLNSVNVSSTLVADLVRKSRTPSLAKVAKMLRGQESNLGTFLTTDPKGKQLPEYLEQLSEHLAGEQSGALEEIARLQKNIEHIKDIVSKQQSYAVVSGVTEIVKVSELVEDALQLNAGSLIRHDIQAVRDFSEVPPISVEKHKVLQILVNLISNAKQACDDSGRSDKRMTVRVANGDGRVKISISDNGVGIPPENLLRIFNHGFTTRKTGHGFGLHSGALAAKQLGGELRAHSEGSGQGSVFTLELPVEQRKNS